MIFVKRFGALAVFLCVLFSGYSYAQIWNEIQSPEGYYCYDILSFSDQDMYVAGYNGTILHYNGNAWQKMSTPTRMPIWSIWGPDANHIYAVGGNGTILFYDGRQWISMDSGTRQWLYDIWGADNENIFAVGAGVILKYNGSDWTHMMIGDDRKTFFAICGNNDHDIYAAGDFGKIYHYNGLGWTEIKSGVAGQIWGLFTSGVHIFAAGTNNNQTTVYHYDGVQWNQTELALTTQLWKIWGSSENDIYMVGDSGTIVTYDGQNWQTQTVGENLRLRSIWGKLGTAYVMAENGKILKKEAGFHIQLGHVSGHAGETIRIPVSLTNTTMNPMEGIDITIDYDPNIIAVQSVSLTGGILSSTHYTLEAELGKPGRVMLVFGATEDCLVGSGVMAYLICHVLEDIGRTGNFKENQWNIPQLVYLSKAEINEQPASVHSGSVTVINYPPIVTNLETISVEEDHGPFEIPFTVHDTETAADALTITVKNNGPTQFFQEPITVIGTYEERTLHLVPSTHVFGETDIQISIFDGINTTQSNVLCTIQPVNDPPVFVKGENISVYEDDGRQLIPNWATEIVPGPTNESDQTVEFIVETQQTTLFEERPQILPNGTLIFKTQSNAFGKAEIAVTLKDNGENNQLSPKQMFVIDIISINDPPAFIPGDSITILEDAGTQIITGWAKNSVAGNIFETGQDIEFKIQSSNISLFDPSQPPQINKNGDLIFSIAPNAFGSSLMLVTMEDNGGTDHGGVSTSDAYPFTITVLPVNDSPSFIPGSDLSIFKNEGFQSYENWATHIKAGPENEKDQIISFHMTNNAPHLFDIQPQISIDGTLTFSTFPDITGEAMITAYLIDDKGTKNKGSDVSKIERFKIKILNYPVVSGAIKYYSNNHPVRNVQLNLDGNNHYQVHSDASGNFAFSDVIPGNYVLTAEKMDDLNGLSGTDASSIFRHASEAHSLNCYEMIAADVSQSGHIGGTDASRVARYRAGLATCLNNSCLEWVFTPANPFTGNYLSVSSPEMNNCQKWPPIAYPGNVRLYNITKDRSNIDFIAFRLGDTTGNWSPDEISTRKSVMNELDDIAEQNIAPLTDGMIQIPLEIEEMTTIYGIDFSVTYDPEWLTAVGATLSESVLDGNLYDLRVNSMQQGHMTGVISATKDLVSAKGTLVFLKFQWKKKQSDQNIDPYIQITIKELACNENKLPLKRFKVTAPVIKTSEDEINELTERLSRFDIHMDNKKGLEEAIDALRSLSDIDAH
ncbi:MAG: hypothetical protein HQK75_08195 [Candidatus Magnetomorum sp.]|nr:hypothetical protein [Candidatus Magnetomorum sp.]